MRLTRHSFALLTLIIGLLALTPAAMAEMYRYTNDQGKTVIGNTLPREARDKGYEILNDNGRVIERVPPPPTEEEIAERERREAAERRRREQKEKQRKIDERLLRQYSSPDDAAQALQRKLRERFSGIKLKLGNVRSLESQIAGEQNRAANMERAGKKVPDALRKRMEKLREEREKALQAVEEEFAAIEDTREEYRSQIERLETLTEKELSVPLTVPEAEEARKAFEKLTE